MVLRGYLGQRALRDIRQAQIFGMIAVGQGPGNREWQRDVNLAVKKYNDAVLGIDSYEDKAEIRMREEYERIKHQTPKLYLDADGRPIVEGVE